MEIYTELYKQATPSLDFSEAVQKGVTAKQNWFMNYYLSSEKQREIFDTIVKKYKCSKQELRKINMAIWLGATPGSVKKNE